MTFAEKLRELRDAAGLSEAKLAKLSGVPFASLHDYGLGRRKPSLAAAVKIARALGTTCDAFAACDDIGDGVPDAEEPPARAPRRKPAAPAVPPTEDLEEQAGAGPRAVGGAKPKRPRARRPKGK